MIDYQKYLISESASIKEALISLNKLSGDILTLFVLNKDSCVIGSITDGDIRRNLLLGFTLDDNVTKVMHTNFFYIEEGNVDVELIRTLRNKGISLLPSLNAGKQIVEVHNLKKRRSILPFDAVMMAGGKGERLRPLTEKIPKPLLKVGNKAIIDYNVDNLIFSGVNNIFVTVNYLSKQIEDHFAEPQEGIQIKCVKEPEFFGTLGSVKFVETFENDTILVMNSDLFTNIDFEDFYLHYFNSGADIMVAAVPYSLNIPYGVLSLSGSEIKGIEEKPTYNHYVNAGIYMIRKKLLDMIPDNTYYDATDLIKDALEKGFKIINYPLTGYWIDIGKHEDYRKVQELAEHLQKRS
jgi:dTDP-glucose pyrophosphorylase